MLQRFGGLGCRSDRQRFAPSRLLAVALADVGRSISVRPKRSAERTVNLRQRFGQSRPFVGFQEPASQGREGGPKGGPSAGQAKNHFQKQKIRNNNGGDGVCLKRVSDCRASSLH
jgi:hypothetical protein